MRQLSPAQRTDIISLLTSGHSAHKVSSLTGIHTSTISRLCRKHCPTLPKSLGGRPTKLTGRNVQHAIRLISSGKADTAVDVTRALQEVVDGSISAQTMRRHLKKAGMKAVVKKKKPLLTPRHRRERLDFALAHRDWTVEDWKRVVWSDETKINRLGSDGRKWAWKRAGEGLSDRLVQGTVKFGGGSVMVWGCMMWEGPGIACKIDGRMDGDLYVTILEDELKPALITMAKTQKTSSSSRTMTPSTPARRPRTGSRIMKWSIYCGQHSLQTSIQLNTYGNTSRGGSVAMKPLQLAYWSCGRGCRMCGTRLIQRCVRN